MELPSGVVTLVFTDIENSAVLSERYRAGFEPLRTTHFRLLREALTRHSGREVSAAGDGLFVVFARASDALQWAVEVQRALEAHSWNIPSLASTRCADGEPESAGGPEETVPLRVRIGMHTGEPFPGQHPDGSPDYFGPAVNRAARIVAAAHGGQILLSNATYGLAQSELPFPLQWRDLGLHRLKGIGEEHLWQVLHPDLPRILVAPATLDPQRHNLPLSLTPFLGREAESALCLEWLTGRRAEGAETGVLPGANAPARLVTITGFGGMGKTRLALHVAELCVESFPQGVCLVELEEARTADDLFQRLVSQLGFPVQPQIPLQEQAHDYLRARTMLLVLDNIEQVAEGGSIVRQLLAAAPGLQCLGTSRRVLELQGERVLELSPLPASDAERLFGERARDRQPAFAITAENREDVAELCRRLEGVPLAIELAASRIAGMTPHDMCSRLGEQFRLLQSRSPDLSPRQRALRATIDWSYGLLAEEDRSLLAQLAVFAGGFTLPDAEAVCEAPDVFERVLELRRNSFFRTETDEAQQARFSMLESVRAYAAEKLQETEDTGERIRRRHAEWFLSLAREQLRKLRSADEVDALRRLEREADNLRAAMEWARQSSPLDHFLPLALCLGVLLWRLGLVQEAVRPIQAGLDLARNTSGANPDVYADLLRERAGLCLDQQAYDSARQLALAAQSLYAQLGDRSGMARTDNLLGSIVRQEQDYGAARAYFVRALSEFEREGDAQNAAIVHNNLGLLECFDTSGSLEAARAHLEEALRRQRQQGDRRGLAETLNNLGLLAYRQGDWETAWRCYQEALEHEQALRHAFGLGRALYNLGEVAVEQGDLDRACRLLAAAEIWLQAAKSEYAADAADLLNQTAARAGQEAARFRRSAQDRPPEARVTWAIAGQ